MLIAGLCLAGFTLWLCWHPREPEWQGIALRQWVEHLRQAGERPQAFRALREIGPNSIPFILRLRQERDTWLYDHYREQWWPRLPQWLQTRLGDPISPAFDDFLIRDALAATGPAGIPRLAQSLKNSHEGTRLSVLLALQSHAKQGADLSPALPDLMRAMDDPSPDVRIYSAKTLGLMGPAAAPAIDLLIRRLSDAEIEVSGHGLFPRGSEGEVPGGSVQAACAAALGRIGPAARPALPALAGFEHHANPDLRFKALVARRQLGDCVPQFVPLILSAIVTQIESESYLIAQIQQLTLTGEEKTNLIQNLLTNRACHEEAVAWQQNLRTNL
jgi:hypothetical protein